MIALLTPARKRPAQLKWMVESALATAKNPFEVIVYVDDDHLDSAEMAYSLALTLVVGPRITLSDMWNKCYEQGTADILMQCTDDCVFRTNDWDVAVENEFSKSEDKLIYVYGNDRNQLKNLGTLGFLHRRWIETVGYITPPYFSSDYRDCWINDVAEALGRRVCLSDVVTEHMHWACGKARMDDTYRENQTRGLWHEGSGLDRDLAPKRNEDIEKLRRRIECLNQTHQPPSDSAGVLQP